MFSIESSGFSMTLDDPWRSLSCLISLWIKYRGNVAFVCSYVIISTSHRNKKWRIIEGHTLYRCEYLRNDTR